LIAYFLYSISVKYYENPAMLSRVIPKNIGDIFETQRICKTSAVTFYMTF